MIELFVLILVVGFSAWAFWRGPPWAKLIASLVVSAVVGLVVLVTLGFNVSLENQPAAIAVMVAAVAAGVATLGVLWTLMRRTRRAGEIEPAAQSGRSSASSGPVDVFISYKRDERALVEGIARRLKALNLSVWFDADMRSGSTFDAEIDRHVRSAKCVLVCWSPGAVASDWVRGEATIGRQRGVLVAAVLVPCSLPAPFNLVHANDLGVGAGPHNPEWRALLATIGALVDRPGLEAYETA